MLELYKAHCCLKSPLPPDECKASLGRVIDNEWKRFGFSRVFGNKDTIGEVRESFVRFRKRLRYRSDFQVYLTVNFEKSGDETLLHVHIGLLPSTRAMLLLIPVLLVLFSIITISFYVLTHKHLGFIFFPIIFLAIFFIGYSYGRADAQEEAGFLLDFLILHTQANLIPEPHREFVDD